MKRKLIGFITSSPDSESVQRLTEGLFSQCKYYGYDVAVISPLVQVCHYFKDYLKGESNIYNLINPEMFDGIIVDTVSLTQDRVTWPMTQIESILKKHNYKNVVAIDIPLADYHLIETDDVISFKKITDHILDVHKCENVWVLDGPENMTVTQKRLKGIKKSFEEHSIKFKERNVTYGDFWYSSGEELAKRIYDADRRPDAVICASDHMAIGLSNGLIRRGIKVPDEIIVTGFDATAEAAINDLAITTYTPESGAAAAEAVNYLRTLIDPDKTVIDSSDAGYGGMLCCDSCGCRTNMKYVRRRLGRSLIHAHINYQEDGIEDNVNIGRLLDSYMFENLTSARTPEDCLKRIYKTDYLIRPYDHFYMCLRKDWLDTEKVVVTGYPDKMRIVMHAVPGVYELNDELYCDDSDKHEFETKLMLPQLLDEDHDPSVFYFSPIHFEENTFGYCVLQCALQKMRKLDIVFHNWIRNIDNALEMARAQNRLLEFSERDALTGLFNRRALDNWFVKNENAEADQVMAMVVDMDGLKIINDNYGHIEGDFGIKTIANVVNNITTESEICVRAGGDEFYLVGLGAYNEQTLLDKQKQFYDELDEINKHSGKDYTVTGSIGSALCDFNGKESFKELLKQADADMYRNKEMRKKNRA